MTLTVLGSALLMGCGGDDDGGDFDRGKAVDELVSAGVSKGQAECFVDKLGNDAGRLMSAEDPDELSEKDAEKMVKAITECVEED